MELPYNPRDRQSIATYAKALVGATLRESCSPEILTHGYSGKGHFGQLLEKFYFLYEPNSDAAPDFPEAKLALKSPPLKQAEKGGCGAKERLVLSVINYHDLVRQQFETSTFWAKNANMLLVFFTYTNPA